MATYDYSGDPTSSPKDAVRFFVQDTGPADWLVSNEEILFVLSTAGAPEAAAANICDAIAAKYSRKPDRQVGDLRISSSQIAQAFRDRATDLRNRVALGAVPYAGGLSKSEKATAAADTDLVQPGIRRGMTDNPERSPAGYDRANLLGGR